MYDIITIGDATVDTFVILDDTATLNCDIKTDECQLCLDFADKIPIHRTAQSVGGNAANVAVGTAKLGLEAAIVSELGDDINGHVITNELENAGVHTHLIKHHKNKETRYSVVLNFKSERTILSFHSERTYSLPKLPKTKWVYYTSHGKSFERLQKQLLTQLRKHKKTKLAFNPGSYQMKHGMKAIKELLPHVDVLFVNREEAQRLLGKKHDLHSCCKALHKRGIQTLVITDGPKGSYASDGTDICFMPSYPIKAKARTGAGDAFASGYMSAHILGKPLRDCLQWGTANAGGVIQEIGAHKGLLNKTQIQRIVKKYPRVKPKSAAK